MRKSSTVVVKARLPTYNLTSMQWLLCRATVQLKRKAASPRRGSAARGRANPIGRLFVLYHVKKFTSYLNAVDPERASEFHPARSRRVFGAASQASDEVEHLAGAGVATGGLLGLNEAAVDLDLEHGAGRGAKLQ